MQLGECMPLLHFFFSTFAINVSPKIETQITLSWMSCQIVLFYHLHKYPWKACSFRAAFDVASCALHWKLVFCPWSLLENYQGCGVLQTLCQSVDSCCVQLKLYPSQYMAIVSVVWLSNVTKIKLSSRSTQYVTHCVEVEMFLYNYVMLFLDTPLVQIYGSNSCSGNSATTTMFLLLLNMCLGTAISCDPKIIWNNYLGIWITCALFPRSGSC